MMRWVGRIGVAIVSLAVLAVGIAGTSQAETANCMNCHATWLDNNPPKADVSGKKALPDYVPLDLQFPGRSTPFYTIGEGYFNSIHASPEFAPANTDYLNCSGCHGNVDQAHAGTGAGILWRWSSPCEKRNDLCLVINVCEER